MGAARSTQGHLRCSSGSGCSSCIPQKHAPAGGPLLVHHKGAVINIIVSVKCQMFDSTR
jgi:hypothetical protein